MLLKPIEALPKKCKVTVVSDYLFSNVLRED